MGALVQTSFANIFVHKLEEKLFLKHRLSEHILLYLRFVDDILLLWNGTQELLLEMVNEANSCHKTVKFTVEVSDIEKMFWMSTCYIGKKQRGMEEVGSLSREDLLQGKGKVKKNNTRIPFVSQYVKHKKILAWPADASHWFNLKLILEELASRGNEITALVRWIKMVLCEK
ncbi:hypothetical protein XELAEV_18005908mg [Xenopus laevis]|uniref:Reverse transcriptase domain-containing protein n=1 Tax=Xenopus laevis TaxID=8355 RepID=A0A974E054_XENLA|nr:hypothetical protein XELAEV_18005908mg [Xenopus laevis]